MGGSRREAGTETCWGGGGSDVPTKVYVLFLFIAHDQFSL